MTSLSIEDTKIKQILKIAFIEVLEEKHDALVNALG